MAVERYREFDDEERLKFQDQLLGLPRRIARSGRNNGGVLSGRSRPKHLHGIPGLWHPRQGADPDSRVWKAAEAESARYRAIVARQQLAEATQADHIGQLSEEPTEPQAGLGFDPKNDVRPELDL
jgi:hypothetical protein